MGKGKVTDDIKLLICSLVDANCTITLKQVVKKVRDTTGVALSDTTISKVLTGMLYSTKKVQVEAQARNSPENKEKRKEYAAWFQSASDEDFVFIDESGFDLWQTRTRGRAKVGCPAKRVVDSQKTPHVTLMFAVAPHHGVVHSQIIRGGTKKSVMQDFTAEVIRSASRAGLNNPWIVIDNAPCHAGLENALEGFPDGLPEHRIRRLPPYSCELNPIESMFNVVKATTKKRLAEEEIMNRLPDETLLAFRFRKMKETIETALPSVTQVKVTAAFRHCLAKVIPRALNMEDL